MGIANFDEVKKYSGAFKAWSKKYSPLKNLNSEDHEQLVDVDSSSVWTEFYFGEYISLSPGFTQPDSNLRAPVQSYYLCAEPWADAQEIVLTAKQFDCESCFGEGEDDEGDECASCEGEGSEWVDFNSVEQSDN